GPRGRVRRPRARGGARVGLLGARLLELDDRKPGRVLGEAGLKLGRRLPGGRAARPEAAAARLAIAGKGRVIHAQRDQGVPAFAAQLARAAADHAAVVADLEGVARDLQELVAVGLRERRVGVAPDADRVAHAPEPGCALRV